MENSGLGYQISKLDKIRSDLPPGSIIPDVLPPKHLKWIHVAITNTPVKHYQILIARFVFPGTDKQKAGRMNIPYATYRKRLNSAFDWIEGFKVGNHIKNT